MNNSISRRAFVRNVALTAAVLGFRPDVNAQSPRAMPGGGSLNDYDRLAKLASNENPYGPPESVLKAMTDAFKYANRYRYPDPGIVQSIAALHGVSAENVLIG